jgi:hypothetical protein
MINVKLFRIVTGEEVVAEIVSEDDNSVTIKNGLVVIPTGQSVGFASWSSVIDSDNPDLVISRNHIVYIAEVDSGINKKYNELFGSKIITPDEKKLIL